MAHAYTPGLKVTGSTTVRKTRRLPLLGTVKVEKGDKVDPTTVIATAAMPGDPVAINLASRLGIEPADCLELMTRQEGETVKEGERIAYATSFFGLFKKEIKAPCDCTIERVSNITGQLVLRQPPIPINLYAYISGTVVDVLPKEGAILETEATFIQGIFGVGGETQGEIKVLSSSPDQILDAGDITPDCKGKVIVGGSLVTGAALKRAASVGVAAIVVGGIIDTDLVELLGYDIGVAITGQEDTPFTLILTEGFGQIDMADKTFELLKAREGLNASISGATQIRAGVMRPELIIPGDFKAQATHEVSQGLEPGTPVRIIREPYFGMLAEVVELPPELQVIESGAKVRILTAKLTNTNEVVTVARANVEMIEE